MSDRLSKDIWIKHGFDVLRIEGPQGLKADRMVKALGVSRGSFYWHFKSLSDFHDQLLMAWQTQITEAVITELKAMPEGHNQLVALFERILNTPQPLEAAMRIWAHSNSKVRTAIGRVDALRIGYMADVMVKAGVDRDHAQTRAVALGWACVGRAMLPEYVDQIDPDTVHSLGHIFLNTEAAWG